MILSLPHLASFSGIVLLTRAADRRLLDLACKLIYIYIFNPPHRIAVCPPHSQHVASRRCDAHLQASVTNSGLGERQRIKK
ncbi:uncharacterized protein EI90DRAFT_3030718 [Cantharellus anzutake]|uniref:uncharacterized protein n=1 Tax=Cantharellus anzutake TaxID=1750568 RepID=UPI0019071C20|nr:uncharacterized protein EI90DRAFT_3030718 [Cantharellus anzutake]KAF8342927.1 hypothetical protein EI90DRAFT_3030718 [Cantharellus anzutake]